MTKQYFLYLIDRRLSLFLPVVYHSYMYFIIEVDTRKAHFSLADSLLNEVYLDQEFDNIYDNKRL